MVSRVPVFAALVLFAVMVVAIIVAFIAVLQDDGDNDTADDVLADLTAVPTELVRPTTLMFCQPLVAQQDGRQLVATLPPDQRLVYQANTCNIDGAFEATLPDGSRVQAEPEYIPPDEVVSLEQIVWRPGTGTVDGVQQEVTGRFLENARLTFDSLDRPVVTYDINEDGRLLFGSMTESNINLPITVFVDGEPLRTTDGQLFAPTVNSRIEDASVFTGLSVEQAQLLVALINTGNAR